MNQAGLNETVSDCCQTLYGRTEVQTDLLAAELLQLLIVCLFVCLFAA